MEFKHIGYVRAKKPKELLSNDIQIGFMAGHTGGEEVWKNADFGVKYRHLKKGLSCNMDIDTIVLFFSIFSQEYMSLDGV